MCAWWKGGGMWWLCPGDLLLGLPWSFTINLWTESWPLFIPGQVPIWWAEVSMCLRTSWPKGDWGRMLAKLSRWAGDYLATLQDHGAPCKSNGLFPIEKKKHSKGQRAKALGGHPCYAQRLFMHRNSEVFDQGKMQWQLYMEAWFHQSQEQD